MTEGQEIAPMSEISEEYRGGMKVTSYSNLDAARQQVQVQTGHADVFRPDFVMAGMTTPEGVMLFASTDLTEAELKREMKGFERIAISDNPHAIMARVPAMVCTLTAKLKTFTIIHADDYPSAMMSLQDLWKRKNSPGDSGVPAITR